MDRVRITPEIPRASLPIRLLRRLRVEFGMARMGLRTRGAGAVIAQPAFVLGGRGIALGAGVLIHRDARLEVLGFHPDRPTLSIGDITYIQRGVHIGAVLEVTIGAGCGFGAGVLITDHDHDFTDPTRAHRDTLDVLAAPVRIGDRVFLGENCLVLPGVTIGEGTIVGAGSIVSRSLPAYAKCAGAPARVFSTFDHASREWRRVAKSEAHA